MSVPLSRCHVSQCGSLQGIEVWRRVPLTDHTCRVFVHRVQLQCSYAAFFKCSSTSLVATDECMTPGRGNTPVDLSVGLICLLDRSFMRHLHLLNLTRDSQAL